MYSHRSHTPHRPSTGSRLPLPARPVALALIVGLALALGACSSATKMQVQKEQILRQVEDMRNRAYRCAPKELALAESHATFAGWELDQGNLRRAEEHITLAAKSSETADMQSRAPECQDVQVVVASDRDGDGYLDDDDQCPDKPEDFDGDEDEDGCPDIEQDQDGDGILDPDDSCPLDPEDFDGFEDVEGCPDADNDADVVCDPWVAEQGRLEDFPCKGTDQCPMDPEDQDGFEDEDGCPDIDNDDDKIVDTEDDCPNDPEDYDGDEDEDGCPEERKLVVVKKDRIELNEPVYFATDKTDVLPRSEPLLDEIADVLKSNSTIEVRIEGHTDSRGSSRYNEKLSQGRADSVRNELVARGIEPTRMVAIGYGEERPIDTNETPEGRQNNRRVEFHITNR